MAPAAYDPYNSSIHGSQEKSVDASIVLFPLSHSANSSQSSSWPREIRSSASQPMGHFSHSETVEACSNDEIAELKRRLQQIKVRRAKQRERTIQLRREQEEREREGTETVSKTRKPISAAPMAPPVEPRSRPPSSTIYQPLRRPSLTSETIGETIDTSIESSNGSLLNPKRWMCSSYQARSLTTPVSKASSTSTQIRRLQTTATTSGSAVSRDINDGERSMNFLDSLVCVRPDQDDPLDLIFCSNRSAETTRGPTSNLKASPTNRRFDPYQSAGVPTSSSTKRFGALEEVVPRTRAFSVIAEEESSYMLDAVATKSCLPRRSPAWYERPDPIDTSNRKGQVMEMVFFSNHPNQAFDGRHRLNQPVFDYNIQ